MGHEPSLSPKAVDALGIYVPSFTFEHGSYKAISVAGMLLCKLVNPVRERPISIRSHRSIPLRRARLSDCPARAPLAHAQSRLNVADGSTLPSRA
jgi:hypothetical protein